MGRSKLDEGKLIGGEIVIAGGTMSALLDLVEEPLNQDCVARDTSLSGRQFYGPFRCHSNA
jgi:hypothetical protein